VFFHEFFSFFHCFLCYNRVKVEKFMSEIEVDGFGCGLGDIDDFSGGFGSKCGCGFGYGIASGYGNDNYNGSSENFYKYHSTNGSENGSGYGSDEGWAQGQGAPCGGRCHGSTKKYMWV
jgi:hypothetical protein